MKNKSTSFCNIKTRLSLTFIIFIFAVSLGFSQSGVLHLYYHPVKPKLPDSTEAKMTAWAKAHTDRQYNIKIVSYYDRAALKDMATERADEIFLNMMRKARAYLIVQSYTAEKGEKYQNNSVDVFFEGIQTPEEKAAAEKAARDKAEAERNAKLGAMDENSKEYKIEKFGAIPTHMASEGRTITKATVNSIKGSKIIIGKSGDKEMDANLEKAVKNFWNFTSDIDVMPYKDAKAAAKANDKALVMFITNVKSKTPTYVNKSMSSLVSGSAEPRLPVTHGNVIMLENGKGTILASSFIPAYGDDEVFSEEVLAFGVSVMNCELKTMSEKGLADNSKIKAAYNEHTSQIKSKTLYVPEMWFSEKLSKTELPRIYQSKSELVNYAKWKDAILKKEDVAYVMVVPQPLLGEYIFVHYLMDAKTGSVYAICQPKTPMSATGVNAMKSNTGYINDVYIEKYNQASNGNW